MLFNQLALAFCLFLLFGIRLAIITAARRGDGRQARVLQFFRLGLSLSAFSYLFRIIGHPPTSPSALLSVLFCFAGTVLIMIGWLEQGNLTRDRIRSAEARGDDNGEMEPPLIAEAGLPALDRHVGTIIRHAREEALRRRQCCLDTDHLLLGLLREPDSAGAHILGRLGIDPRNIRLALGQIAERGRPSSPLPPPVQTVSRELLPLTDRARQALVLAGQEAHRFDKTSVGTDHLLLGLLLMGTGAAAASLFHEGLTVEEIRHEVLKSGRRG